MSSDETILDALRAQVSAWRLRADRLDADKDAFYEAESQRLMGNADGARECAKNLEALIARWTK